MTSFVVARLVIAAAVALTATRAQAQCLQWDASGKWTIAVESEETISLNLKQNGIVMSGTATGHGGGNGTVEGTMKEDAFQIKITWSGKEIGSETYIAKVTSDGKLDGTALVFAPLPKTIKWSSDRVFACVPTL